MKEIIRTMLNQNLDAYGENFNISGLEVYLLDMQRMKDPNFGL